MAFKISIPGINLPPIWREPLLGAEMSTLLRSNIFNNPYLIGQGQPIITMPGLMAGDSSLKLLNAWLTKIGFNVINSGINVNVDCSEKELNRLTTKLHMAYNEYSQPVTLIGHSRGGLFAKVLAVRYPHMVKGIITLGSPHKNALEEIHPALQMHLLTMSAVQDKGNISNMMSLRCINYPKLAREGSQAFIWKIIIPRVKKKWDDNNWKESCCHEYWLDIDSQVPESVKFISIYSEKDGIVNHHSCLDESAQCIKVGATHCGMITKPEVYKIIGQQLHQLFTGELLPSSSSKSPISQEIALGKEIALTKETVLNNEIELNPEIKDLIIKEDKLAS